MSEPSVIGLIPARAGSKRVPGKNIRRLGRHPMLAYTIAAAEQSGVFRRVVVSTDSEDIAAIARHYGADVPALRPAHMAEELSPDIDWIEHMLALLRDRGESYDAFSILRPTNPFRQPDTIRRAWSEFRADPVDSLRAVEKCKQHPGKMWVVRGRRMTPLLPVQPEAQPWHSTPYQALPVIYVQTAALEIAWTRCVWNGRTIAGVTIMPFLMPDHEGLDINEPADWSRAEELTAAGAALPVPSQEPFPG